MKKNAKPKRTETRFRYNLGIFKICAFLGDEWTDASPEFAGSYAKGAETLQTFEVGDSKTKYGLFHLQENEETKLIEWVQSSSDCYYAKKRQTELHKILYELGLSMSDRGYSALANITKISKTSISNMFRQPKDPRFQPVTQEGLLYIRYRVQQYQQGK